MFTDNALQYRFSNKLSEKINNGIRKNPFLHEIEIDQKEESTSSIQSAMSLDNSLLVYDHFDRPLSDCDFISSVEDLTVAVKTCKQKILTLIDDPELKNKYIERLIELNEALHTAKETISTRRFSESSTLSNSNENIINLAGHKLIKYRYGLTVLRHCEVCHGSVRSARMVYKCEECLVHIHTSKSCLQGLHRSCPASDRGHPSMFESQIMTRRRFSSADIGYHIDIDSFPLTGNLISQKFLCAECSFPLKAISSTDLHSSLRSQPKFCHYYRKFYCYNCHWDNRHLIPSVYFMLNKWKKMLVCRSAYIKLKYMWDRALFRMPIFWEQNFPVVKNIFIIRKRLFALRIFIFNCQTMRTISESYSEWLIDQPYLVTMRFVEEISEGSGLERVQVLYSNIIAHIPNCESCKGLCNPCFMCSDPEKLYVVSRTVWTCSVCFVTCVHENCALNQYKEKSEFVCPKCYKKESI